MAALEYLDFDLEVEASAAPDTYKVSVLASPRGEASGEMTFPFDPVALENVILKLGRTRSGVRAVGSPTHETAKKFGASLYDALFAGEVGTSFRRSLDEADAQGKGLRVRLRLAAAPQLADVPWEYLYPTGLRQFLVLSTRTPIVRYLELAQRVAPLEVTPPLRVLVAVAAPTNLATLDVDAEVRHIREALAELERNRQVEIGVLPNVTLRELRRRLRSEQFHVLHFIGHGGFDDRTAEGMLAFEDEHRVASLVSGTSVATAIRDFDSLRLVLLNACEGARQSPADPFGGVAQSLVRQGNIPAVVAMQFEITDEAAKVFSSEFYAAIADGYPIDAALAEARVAVFSDDNDVEWGTPVLYLRASDGRIFDVTGGGAGATAETPTNLTTAGAGGSVGVGVVPVTVPGWPTSPEGAPEDAAAGSAEQSRMPQGEVGSGSGGGGSGGPDASPDSAAGADRPRDDSAGRPGPEAEESVERRRGGARWLLLGAVAAVIALAVVLWPRVFAPSGPVGAASPVISPSLSADPPPSESVGPSPVRTSTTNLPPVRDVGTLKAVRGRVSVDGSTDDWQWQLVARADNQIARTSAATAEVYLMWDDEALYLLALVEDATRNGPNPSEPNRAWRGDSIILELGPDKRQLQPGDRARPTDAYYMFGLATTAGPVMGILGPNGQATDFSAPRDSRTLDAAISITRSGYVLEARIPWRTTRLNGVRAGAVFAANVNVADRKTDTFANQGMRSTNPQRTLEVRMHPAYWQGLELLA